MAARTSRAIVSRWVSLAARKTLHQATAVEADTPRRCKSCRALHRRASGSSLSIDTAVPARTSASAVACTKAGSRRVISAMRG